MSGIVGLGIVIVGNIWLAKITLDKTTEWRSIIPLGVLAVIVTTCVNIAIHLKFLDSAFAESVGEIPSHVYSDMYKEIVFLGGIGGLLLGFLVFFITILLKRRKAIKERIYC